MWKEQISFQQQKLRVITTCSHVAVVVPPIVMVVERDVVPNSADVQCCADIVEPRVLLLLLLGEQVVRQGCLTTTVRRESNRSLWNMCNTTPVWILWNICCGCCCCCCYDCSQRVKSIIVEHVDIVEHKLLLLYLGEQVVRHGCLTTVRNRS